MTCCSDSVCALDVGRGARRRLGGLSGDGDRALDVLSLEAQGRPLGARGAAGQRAPAAADAEPDRPAPRAADPGLRAGPARSRAAADLRGAWAREVGRDPDLRARRLAGARRFNLNTRSKRLGLVARHAEPYERKPELPPPERHIDASEPGERVQLDCFFVGRLSGSKGTVWQYTAADVASGFIWAELHSSERNPRARWTAEL